MSAQLRIEVTVYCDGATHWPPLEGTLRDVSKAAIREFVARCGWTMTRDGRTLCPEHKVTRR